MVCPVGNVSKKLHTLIDPQIFENWPTLSNRGSESLSKVLRSDVAGFMNIVFLAIFAAMDAIVAALDP